MLLIVLGSIVFAVSIIDLCGIYSRHPVLPDSAITKENIEKWLHIPGMRFFFWCLLIGAVLAVMGLFEILA